MLLNCGVGEDSWKSLGLQGDQTSQSQRKSVLNILWRDWCRSWSSNILVTWCEESTHLKRSWCWDRLNAGGEGDNRGWDGWMASLTRWTWVWISSGTWWWTGKCDVLQSVGSQSWTWLSNWTELIYFTYGNVSFHVTFSIHLTLSSPLPMSISLFSMFLHCCLANKFISTIFLDSLYTHCRCC